MNRYDELEVIEEQVEDELHEDEVVEDEVIDELLLFSIKHLQTSEATLWLEVIEEQQEVEVELQLLLVQMETLEYLSK